MSPTSCQTAPPRISQANMVSVAAGSRKAKCELKASLRLFKAARIRPKRLVFPSFRRTAECSFERGELNELGPGLRRDDELNQVANARVHQSSNGPQRTPSASNASPLIESAQRNARSRGNSSVVSSAGSSKYITLTTRR